MLTFRLCLPRGLGRLGLVLGGIPPLARTIDAIRPKRCAMKRFIAGICLGRGGPRGFAEVALSRSAALATLVRDGRAVPTPLLSMEDKDAPSRHAELGPTRGALPRCCVRRGRRWKLDGRGRDLRCALDLTPAADPLTVARTLEASLSPSARVVP